MSGCFQARLQVLLLLSAAVAQRCLHLLKDVEASKATFLPPFNPDSAVGGASSAAAALQVCWLLLWTLGSRPAISTFRWAGRLFGATMSALPANLYCLGVVAQHFSIPELLPPRVGLNKLLMLFCLSCFFCFVYPHLLTHVWLREQFCRPTLLRRNTSRRPTGRWSRVPVRDWSPDLRGTPARCSIWALFWETHFSWISTGAI